MCSLPCVAPSGNQPEWMGGDTQDRYGWMPAAFMGLPADYCTADPSVCPGKSEQQKIDDVIETMHDFCDILTDVATAPQPNGQCKAEFFSLPDLLAALDNDKLRRTAAQGAKFLRELGTINWQMPAPPSDDPMWDLLDPETAVDDLDIGQETSDALNHFTLAFAMALDQFVEAIPPGAPDNQRFAQSPWDLTDWFWDIIAGDYVQVAQQSLSLVRSHSPPQHVQVLDAVTCMACMGRSAHTMRCCRRKSWRLWTGTAPCTP
jgi:hypothetical protein